MSITEVVDIGFPVGVIKNGDRPEEGLVEIPVLLAWDEIVNLAGEIAAYLGVTGPAVFVTSTPLQRSAYLATLHVRVPDPRGD